MVEPTLAQSWKGPKKERPRLCNPWAQHSQIMSHSNFHARFLPVIIKPISILLWNGLITTVYAASPTMFEIRDLQHLLSLDEHRHFGRAAAAVGLSQPALTKSLQRLERILDTRLFDRSRARVSPTAVGEEVIAQAQARRRSERLEADCGIDDGSRHRLDFDRHWSGDVGVVCI